ncbi:MAG: hypothetical protein LPH21_03045, partial [Shewanella sp.]|nr:hypothetical protein [Shewanella sp.]
DSLFWRINLITPRAFFLSISHHYAKDPVYVVIQHIPSGLERNPSSCFFCFGGSCLTICFNFKNSEVFTIATMIVRHKHCYYIKYQQAWLTQPAKLFKRALHLGLESAESFPKLLNVLVL